MYSSVLNQALNNHSTREQSLENFLQKLNEVTHTNSNSYILKGWLCFRGGFAMQGFILFFTRYSKMIFLRMCFKQVEVLQESRMMIPDCHRRLAIAHADLQQLLVRISHTHSFNCELC